MILSNYAAPTLCNLLSEMKGWQRLELPVVVKASGGACVDVCGNSYLSWYLDSLSMQVRSSNSTDSNGILGRYIGSGVGRVRGVVFGDVYEPRAID
jgi:hypothetical protein